MIAETLIRDIPELKVHGRTTSCLSPLTLFWTASGFECNVSGSELWVEIEVTYDTFEPWFSYTINEDWIGRQMLVKGRYWVPLFRGMNEREIKNVHFYKDLQAMSDDGSSLIQIHALRHDGMFYPVEEKCCKLEFIGDSITSGEGLFGAKKEWDWIPMFFSAIKSYTYQTAQLLNGEYRVFSQSGWGIHSGWDNNIRSAIPQHYKEICSLMPGKRIEQLGAKEPYDFTKWQPDWVIVNLGTNDAGAFDQPAWVDEANGTLYKMRRNKDGSYNMQDICVLQQEVKDFIQLLRTCNPKAHILWCYGMIGIELQPWLREAVEDYVQQTNDTNVAYLQLPAMTEQSAGSREHPGFACHRQAAQVLTEYIRNQQ